MQGTQPFLQPSEVVAFWIEGWLRQRRLAAPHIITEISLESDELGMHALVFDDFQEVFAVQPLRIVFQYEKVGAVLVHMDGNYTVPFAKGLVQLGKSC